MWHTTKIIFWTFMSGAAVGGYGVYEYVYVPFQVSIIDRGYCGQRDPFGTPFRYGCRDSMVAMELNQRAIDSDHENAEIIADMQRSQPKKKKRP